MIQAIRSIFGYNVRTPEIRIVVENVALTPHGIRALIQKLRLSHQEDMNILQSRQMEILSLLRENSRLKREASLWLDDWIKINDKSNEQKVNIHNA